MTDTTAVAAWYNENAESEHSRLVTFSLEYAITLDTILKCIEKVQAGQHASTLKILDLGGGAGRYAVELARRGHQVSLVDISSAELEHAKVYAEKEGVSLDAVIEADARTIHYNEEIFRPGYFDIVLCLGPFYHLTKLRERQQLLQDCTALCSSGGFVLAAFVTRWAHLRDIAQRDPERVFRENEFYSRYLNDGDYNRMPSRTGHHTTVNEIRSLYESAIAQTPQGNLKPDIQQILACEGFLGGGLSEKISSSTEEIFEKWVEINLRLANSPEMLGAADHLLVVSQAVPH